MTFHGFDVGHAVAFGLPEAVMIRTLAGWVAYNRAEGRHRHPGPDGALRTWTYNSVRAWAELIPYWTPKQVRRLLDRLVGEGVLLAAQLGPPGDQTHWYAFRDERRFVPAWDDAMGAPAPAPPPAPPAHARASTANGAGPDQPADADWTMPPVPSAEALDAAAYMAAVYASLPPDHRWAGHRVPLLNGQQLRLHVRDPEAWARALEVWARAEYSPLNLSNLLDRYRELADPAPRPPQRQPRRRSGDPPRRGARGAADFD